MKSLFDLDLLPIITDGTARISTSEKNMLNSSLRNSISSSHKYEALTRSDLSGVLEEYNFQASGFVDDQQRVEIGGMSGADYICLPKLTKDGVFCYLEVSLIEVSSGLIASSASSFLKNDRGSSMDIWDQTTRGIVSDLMRYSREDLYQAGCVGLISAYKKYINVNIIEKKPSFMGGTANAFSRWVADHLFYPEVAQENGVQGRVMLQFTILSTGEMSNVKVLRGVDESLDKEAVRVVSSSPKWTPGKQRNKAVRVKYTFPVVFQLR